jgi:lipoyl(octanoyl) transferase
MTHSKHIINKILEDTKNQSQDNLYLYDLRDIDYELSLSIQEEIHSYVKNADIPGMILSLEYPDLFTIGKSGDKSDILISQAQLELEGIKVYESSRGGEITYHGPGQLIYYPIINLKKLRIKPVEYIRILQKSVIDSLNDFGVQADHINKPVGVWVDGKKISSIGVRISKSVSMHGVAINLNCDLNYFTYIIPCGIKDLALTNIHNETKANCDRQLFTKSFLKYLNINIFNL